jgi:hypothetical protein
VKYVSLSFGISRGKQKTVDRNKTDNSSDLLYPDTRLLHLLPFPYFLLGLLYFRFLLIVERSDWDVILIITMSYQTAFSVTQGAELCFTAEVTK